ncbi:hypothetical protein M5Z45_11190, partial [Neisseria meningitidis]|nr:hypothetical protein [Neisseria meningitidis]
IKKRSSETQTTFLFSLRLSQPFRHNHSLFLRRFYAQARQDVFKPCRQLGVAHIAHCVRPYPRLAIRMTA